MCVIGGEGESSAEGVGIAAIDTQTDRPFCLGALSEIDPSLLAVRVDTRNDTGDNHHEDKSTEQHLCRHQ